MPSRLSRATLTSRPSSRKLLARLLEVPDLSKEVQALPAPLLGKLIEHVGLEDAGELVALATTEQLAGVFEQDLWRSERAGEDERFDAQRFVLWLEVMLEAGDRFVAERLAELPQDLVTLAFHRHLLVMSLDDLRAELTAGDDDAESAEKAFENCLSEELEDFQVIWRGGDGFDHVLAALLAFDRDHHTLCSELLERCASLSREHLDDNGGLYAVLSSEEMLEADLGAEREERRAERGFVAPSSAAAFLRLARGSASRETPFTEHDPLTRAYFRQLKPGAAPLAASTERAGAGQGLQHLLESAGMAEAPRPLLTANARGRKPESPLSDGLRALRASSPERFAERSEELAYLSNVLAAGASIDGRRLRPLEAVEHTLEVVGLGLLLAAESARPSARAAAEVLARFPADGLFRLAVAHAQQGDPETKRQIGGESLNAARALLKRLRV